MSAARCRSATSAARSASRAASSSRSRARVASASSVARVSSRTILIYPDSIAMSIPNRHRSPKSVRGRFSWVDVGLQVDPIEQILELALADREHRRALVHRPGDPERPPIKSLVKNAESPSIEEQNLERRPTLAEEHEQCPAPRTAAQLLGDHAREPLESPSENNRVEPDEHLDAVRDHWSRPLSTSSSTVESVARSTPASTRTRTRASRISMMIAPRPLDATTDAGPIDLTALASRMPELAAGAGVPSRPRRDDHQRSVPTANPWLALNSSAVSPLARHAATRDRQICFVSAIATHDAPRRSLTPERGSCTGYTRRTAICGRVPSRLIGGVLSESDSRDMAHSRERGSRRCPVGRDSRSAAGKVCPWRSCTIPTQVRAGGDRGIG